MIEGCGEAEEEAPGPDLPAHEIEVTGAALEHTPFSAPRPKPHDFLYLYHHHHHSITMGHMQAWYGRDARSFMAETAAETGETARLAERLFSARTKHVLSHRMPTWERV